MLKGKIALVTGGGSGIGRATSILFAEEGASVVIANRRIEKGLETVELIRQQGGEAFFVRTNVAEEKSVEDLINIIIKKYGRLDCAFNNAGMDGKRTDITECSEKDWDEIMDINLKGSFWLMKYEIKQMLIQKYGSIVNMASVCGLIARPKRAAYNSSRHGLIGLTKSAALDYSGQGIRTNIIAPGAIKTDILLRSAEGGNPKILEAYANASPIGRIAEPKEVGEAALWLCSDRSSFVTGHTLVVDGGFTIQ